MRIPEKIESGPDIAPARNENFKNAVQVFDRRLAIEFHHGIKDLQGLVRQISLSVELNNVGEENRGERVAIGFELNQKLVNEREVFGAAEFEDKGEAGRVRVAEVGLTGGVVEDFFGEKRVCLGGDEFLDSGRRPNGGIGIGRLLFLLWQRGVEENSLDHRWRETETATVNSGNRS